MRKIIMKHDSRQYLGVSAGTETVGFVALRPVGNIPPAAVSHVKGIPLQRTLQESQITPHVVWKKKVLPKTNTNRPVTTHNHIL
jgi:hypothetical protein